MALNRINTGFKLKENEYRCSCCDEVKNYNTDLIWKKWEKSQKTYGNVGICRKCNAHMNKLGIKTVKTFNKKGIV